MLPPDPGVQAGVLAPGAHPGVPGAKVWISPHPSPAVKPPTVWVPDCVAHPAGPSARSNELDPSTSITPLDVHPADPSESAAAIPGAEGTGDPLFVELVGQTTRGLFPQRSRVRHNRK